MPRKAEGTGKVRAELERITLDLIEVETWLPEIELRIEQAERRTGLRSLLGPALTELSRISAAVMDAKSSIIEAHKRLMSK